MLQMYPDLTTCLVLPEDQIPVNGQECHKHLPSPFFLSCSFMSPEAQAVLDTFRMKMKYQYIIRKREKRYFIQKYV